MKTVTSVSIKKRKALAGEPKPQKRPRKVILPQIVQDHSNMVEQTYTNNNAEQATTVS